MAKLPLSLNNFITNHCIHITDENKVPLSGNFSLAVVDANGINIDTTSNIVSSLLLSSELKGYIESPMSYLQKDNKKSAAALDILLMTQGWRRYDIPNLLKEKLTKDLKYPVELSEEVSGKAEEKFSALKDGKISLLALKDSVVIGTVLTKPDSDGKFIFKDLEYKEGTRYIIQANTKSKSGKVFIQMDSVSHFLSLTPPVIMAREGPVMNDTVLFTTSKKYSAYDGMKVYNLEEVMVTAKRKPIITTESPYYSITSSGVVTAKEIEEWHPQSVPDVLRRIPGVTVINGKITYFGESPKLVLLDNVPTEGYSTLNVDDIQEAYITPGTIMGIMFGSRGCDGAIIINTKKGFVQTNKISSNIKIVKALGYQQPVQFYSPVYSTEQEKESSKPDYRTTIHWNPNVQVDSTGIVNLSFYAADIPTKYSVILEGVSSLGHLIHSSQYEISIGSEK